MIDIRFYIIGATAIAVVVLLALIPELRRDCIKTISGTIWVLGALTAWALLFINILVWATVFKIGQFIKPFGQGLDEVVEGTITAVLSTLRSQDESDRETETTD